MSYQEIYHQIKYYITQFVLLVCTKNMHNIGTYSAKKKIFMQYSNTNGITLIHQ